jgi:hypothetical protein
LLSQEKAKMSADEIGLVKLYGPNAKETSVTIPETEGTDE